MGVFKFEMHAINYFHINTFLLVRFDDFKLLMQVYLGQRRDGGMVYTRDLKSLAFTGLRVRVPLSAPLNPSTILRMSKTHTRIIVGTPKKSLSKSLRTGKASSHNLARDH